MNLFARLPHDIIVHRIIPFTYQCQSNDLLQDIRSFFCTYRILHNVYLFEYNESIWIHDLVEFIIRYNIQMISKKFMDSISENKNKKMKIRLIWGYMTRLNRNKFIHIYI